MAEEAVEEVDETCHGTGETGTEEIEIGATEIEEEIGMVTGTEVAPTPEIETETTAGTVERPLLGSKRG